MTRENLVRVIDDALTEALDYPAIGVTYEDGAALAELIADRILGEHELQGIINA